jgi:predicted nucleic acid-binding protein
MAVGRRIHFAGTVGVLRAAADLGLPDLRDTLTRLWRTNFRIAQGLIDRLVADAER